MYITLLTVHAVQESGVNGGSPSLQRDSTASNYLLQETGPAEYTPLQLLKHRDFWILWFTFLCNNQGICYVSTYWKVSSISLIKIV